MAKKRENKTVFTITHILAVLVLGMFRRVVFENLRLTLSVKRNGKPTAVPRIKVMNVWAALVMPYAFFFNPFAVLQDDERNYCEAGKKYHRKSFYLNGDDS